MQKSFCPLCRRHRTCAYSITGQGHSLGNIYAIRMAGNLLFEANKNYIEKFSPALERLSEKEFSLKSAENKDLDFVYAMAVNNQPYIFAKTYDKSKGMCLFFCHKNQWRWQFRKTYQNC